MSADLVDALRARIASALKDAMRARGSVSVNALRALLHAIDNASAVPVATTRGATPADTSTATEVARRVPTLAEVDEREQAARVYDDVGSTTNAQRLRAEAAVIRAWLEHSNPA